eukprot:Ihof_evm4s383 gene=Ihof_evmTU4s383
MRKPLMERARRDKEYQEVIISDILIAKIFSTASEIYNLHLVPYFHSLQASEGPLTSYTTYINNYDEATATLQSLRSDPKFTSFLEERRMYYGIREDLSDLLICPVQRIPRYVLLLEQIIKYTPEDHPDYLDLND